MSYLSCVKDNWMALLLNIRAVCGLGDQAGIQHGE